MFNPFNPKGGAKGMAGTAKKMDGPSTPSPWSQPAKPGSIVTDVGASSGPDQSIQNFGIPDQKFPNQNFSPGVPQTFSGSSSDLRGMGQQAIQAALQSPRIQSMLGGNGLLAALLKGRV